MKLPIYFWAELLALIVCLVTIPRIRHTILVWFLPFLLLIVVYEFGILQHWEIFFIDKRNHWAANIISTIEILFYSFVYYSSITSRKVRKIIFVSTIAFLMLTLLNIVFVQGFNKFHTITYRLGSAMVIVWIYIYLRQLMNSPEITSLTREPLYWISAGLFLFLIGFIMYLSAFDFIAYQQIKKYAFIYVIIRYSLIVQFYVLISIGFLCLQRPTK